MKHNLKNKTIRTVTLAVAMGISTPSFSANYGPGIPPDPWDPVATFKLNAPVYAVTLGYAVVLAGMDKNHNETLVRVRG